MRTRSNDYSVPLLAVKTATTRCETTKSTTDASQSGKKRKASTAKPTADAEHTADGPEPTPQALTDSEVVKKRKITTTDSTSSDSAPSDATSSNVTSSDTASSNVASSDTTSSNVASSSDAASSNATSSSATSSSTTDDTKPVWKAKAVPYVKGKKIAYGYVLEPKWLTREAKTIVDEKGRRMWNKYSCYDIEHAYARRLLASVGFGGGRATLMEHPVHGTTFAIFWRSNFGLKCRRPPPEVEQDAIKKLKAKLNTQSDPCWFYITI